MSEIESLRREMDKELRKPGEHPDRSLNLTRRIFLHRSLLTGAVVTGATYGWFPLLNTIEVAHAQDRFQFAWVSDTHLYPKDVNERFVEKTVRAFKEVQAMNPPADFHDLRRRPGAARRSGGAQARRRAAQGGEDQEDFIPGEHDWYLDMGTLWNKHVRRIAVDLRPQGRAHHRARHRQPRAGLLDRQEDEPERAHGPHGDARWHARRRLGRRSARSSSRGWTRRSPTGARTSRSCIFSHTPLYEYYPPWNFWIRDWREVHEILKPYSNVTNVHGHTHQVLYNEIGNMRSIGMLATSWPWPYAPGRRAAR